MEEESTTQTPTPSAVGSTALFGKWISLREAFPPEGVPIILYSNGVVQERLYRLQSGDVDDRVVYWWDGDDDTQDDHEIKIRDQWMALPESPNVKLSGDSDK